ncbi:MAG: hypothetical protein P8M30_08705 [Planctomycetaceae bacterium]|jgi:hypothetical protein|nr:hypothetical protein [Planctomycetaceae bacterium]MDG2389385.1 hypothetical protein [Planctomycetaceae bacterium]
MTHQRVSLKNIFLYSLIASVCLSALFGIIVILSGDFGEMKLKFLLTSLTISGASLGGLCCGAAFEARRVPHFATAGVLLIGMTALMILFGMWTEFDWELYWKMVGTMSAFSGAFAHLSLLHMARLKSSYRYVTWAAYAVDFLMCGIISYMIWSDFNLFNEELIFRLLGVDAILIGVVSILLPILHRLSRGELDLSGDNFENILADIDAEISTLKQRIDVLETQKFKMLENV